jgi:predicted aminopeptidase
VSWRLLGRFTAFGVLAFAILFVISPTGCYVSRAAYEEMRILSRRQPIDRVVADSTTPLAEREKLRLVQAARAFARDSLGLAPKETFTRYSRLDRDTLVLVVSAAYPDRLARRTWWFPIVGRFPYKGYFNFGDALKSAESMRAEGFDVSVGASSAFSTLGWFNDPLVSTTLRMDSVSLVNTVIHEIAHTTFFAKGQVVFNESFASFVGGRGAVAFFRALGDSAAMRRAEQEWADDRRLGRFWAATYATLDSAFAAHPDSLDPAGAREARLAARAEVYAAARARLVDSVAPMLETYPAGWAERVPLDNAVLMARRVYATGLDEFEAVWEREGRGVAAAVRRIVELARASPEDPTAAVRRWLK